MTDPWLKGIAARHRRGGGAGVTSVCSAHPLVIEVALEREAPVLIEATCNQVNQEGGYTGMTPAKFRRFVEGIAKRTGRAPKDVVLGGDHLGPNPWRHLDADVAMQRAETLVADFAEAGFGKLHLDTSMACRGEVAPLPEPVVAERAARLVASAEAAARADRPLPLYVIGTEVPPPGGAAHALAGIEVTRPEAVKETIASHRKAFAAIGQERAFQRVIAVVVQPGVEFDQENVVVYDAKKAKRLVATLASEPQFVFEAHSTDYQPVQALEALVQDGFSILKVGPALTFALREALYGLDEIATEIDRAWRELSLKSAMERLMRAEPGYWQAHYPGSAKRRRLLRHYSLSDRIRYYWPHPEAQTAVQRLLDFFADRPVPQTLISQFLPLSYAAVRDRRIAATPDALLRDAVGRALAAYPQSHCPTAPTPRRRRHESDQ